MMPLPQLLDGLGRGRPEIVQKALSLHRRAFRLEFLSNLIGGASSLTEEHVTKMAILFETIVNHSKKADKNPTFRLSVVNFTLDHIKALVQELESMKLAANSASIQQKKAVLELLNFHQNYFQTMRDQIAVIPDAIPGQGKFVTLAHVHSSNAPTVLMQNLSSKTDEEVVRYALLSSDAVACAQQVLLSRGGRSIAEMTEFFQVVADTFISELLEKRQIDVAKDVLHNTDRDIWPTLKNICLTTVNSNIRDYLALELNSISLLEPVEIDVWKFLILIEGTIKNTDLRISISEDNFKISKCPIAENQLELSISLLLALPLGARRSLLSELYFETLDGTLEPMLIRDECWAVLLSNNRLEILIKWIHVTSHKSSQYYGKKDRLMTFLSSWNVTQEMIDFIPQSECSLVTEDCLLDCLSKFGLYTTYESSNIHKHLQRAIRTGQIFNQWNEKIEKLFVDFCVQCNMPDLLVSCGIRTDLQSTAWLKLYSKFQALKDDPSQKNALWYCLEHSANYLKLTKADDQCLSLASFFLLDQSLSDKISGTVGDDAAENCQLLQNTLSYYPHLLSFWSSRNEQKPVDISLQLLLKQKYSSNSSHHILKQESLCSMFKDDPEEIEVDFSHEPTILLHGHNEMLDLQYFLRQGRPCHAAMLVLGEVIRNYGKPSRKLLKRAILSAHELAFSNMTDQLVISSCIAFIEMLGATSLTLRTHVATVKQILTFSAEEACCDKPEKTSNTEPLLHQFMAQTGAFNSHDIFELLVHSLPLDMSLQGLAVQFAHLHKLPFPRDFLVHCAQKNDWITFLLFCQIYSYPSDVVKHLARQFQSTSLREHFESFLLRYPAPGRTLSRTASESVRQRTLSRTLMSDASREFEITPTEAVPAPLVTSGVKDSLFGVLLACHNCADPAEALLHSCVELPCPVLAVLAECYQVNAEAQLAAWLASWLPQEERINFECWQKNVPWPPEIIESLILRSLEMSRSNLLKGFKIFIPEHPLVLVFEVLEEFPHQDILQSVQALQKFKACSTLENDQELLSGLWCLSNSLFVFNIGIKVLLNFLEHLSPAHDIREFLIILWKSSIPFSPEGKPLDISKLLMALDILSPTEVQVNVVNYIRNSEEELRLCTDKLLSLEMYKEASELSENKFVVLEQKGKFKRCLDGKYQDFRAFCADCNFCFEQATVDPFEAFKFFQQCALDLQSNLDRWRALHFAVKWLQHSNSNSQDKALTDEVEMEMWFCCINRKDVKIYAALAEELHHSPLSALCSKELAQNSFTFTEAFHRCGTLCEEQPCSSQLINSLLDIGDILSASRVHKIFQSNHKDFEILVACIHLAEGKLKVQQIPNNWALFSALKIGDIHPVSPRRDEEQKTMLDNSDNMESPSHEKLKVLSVVQELSKQLKHGKDIGKQVVACYRLAMNLGLPYIDVIAVTEPLKLLRTAISQTYSGDFSIASDIMIALRLSPIERAKFLSREIIAAISKGPAPGNVKAFLLWGHDMEQHFQHFLELVSDPSLLGSELMNMVSKLVTSDKNTPKAVLTTTVELLVRAHDCYAAGCTMEGISQVLRTVSNFTPILKARSEWALMVRLLTGIQRYTEMNYIFKMLKESDHFEFLLRKDSVKPLGFKLALLDWLRRECSHDTALLKMTAAHFQMHQQEGELWQKEGNDRLSDLVQQGLLNNQKTKASLQMAMQDFSHASESYLQADMLNHAMACAHQAELVALQLHLLSSHSDGSILRVIMLDSKSVAKLTVSTLSFNQALIVGRAYNHRTDWAAALFYHCVSPGLSAEEYFLAWSSCMELTPAIVQNIAYRLQRTAGVTRDMTSNMQWLLGHVMDMDVRYKIASELGLKDMVESLLQAPEVAYLKDTVWQSGFKR